MISYKHVYALFPKVRGYQPFSTCFETVSIFSTTQQPKGLYVPIQAEDSLKDALYHGAIATLWEREKKLPSFVPNHFPVFFVDHLLDSLLKVTEQYIEKLKKGSDKKTTSFIFYDQIDKNATHKQYTLNNEKERKQLLDVMRQYAEKTGRG